MKVKVESYRKKDGTVVKPSMRDKAKKALSNKIKNYAAGGILTAAAWQLGGKKASGLAGKAYSKLANTKQGQLVASKIGQAFDAGANKLKLGHTLKSTIKSTGGLIIPLAVTGYAGAKATQETAKAIGWSVDRNRKENDGKIKIRTRY
jgi:hypothetical protein